MERHLADFPLRHVARAQRQEFVPSPRVARDDELARRGVGQNETRVLAGYAGSEQLAVRASDFGHETVKRTGQLRQRRYALGLDEWEVAALEREVSLTLLIELQVPVPDKLVRRRAR